MKMDEGSLFQDEKDSIGEVRQNDVSFSLNKSKSDQRSFE